MTRYYLAAAALLALFVIACSIEQADATNIDVSVTSACVNGTTWQVTLNAHNTHTAPLRIVNDNNVENYGAILAPGEAQHVRIEPPTDTFIYVWSSPTAHLVGVLSGTLTRPDGCTIPTTTTEAPPSTTSPTTAPTAPPTSTRTASTTPPAATTAPGPPLSGGATSPSRPPSSTPVSLTLPTTGTDPTLGAVVGLVFVVGGLLMATRRRAS